MENITNININSICRSCLNELRAEKNAIFNIHELPKIAELVKYCTDTAPSEKDGLPPFLCKLCCEKFNQFLELRATCLQSYRILQSYLNQTQSPIKTRSSLTKDRKLLELNLQKFTNRIERSSKKILEEIMVDHSTDESISLTAKKFEVRDELAITKISEDEFPNEEVKTGETFMQISGTLCRKTTKLKFLCNHCPKRCTSQENLNAHLRTHQGLKPYKCSHCERSFNKSYNLKMHIRDEHIEKSDIICTIQGCNKQFKREGSYKTHLRIKHSENKPVFKTFICEDCGRTFKNMTRLKEHRYKHVPVEEYPFQCEHCGKRYTSQRTYKDHLLRHSGIKNFECPYCGLKKTTRNELRTHINYHTKERQWKCPHCPSVFNNSANLGMHDRIVHKGIRRYSCRYCDLSFGKADTLKHHEMRHTGEKPHECPFCQKRFIQAVALRTHLKTHNKVNKNALIETRITSNSDIKSESPMT